MSNDSIKYSLLAAADNENSLHEIEQEFVKNIASLKSKILSTPEEDELSLQELKQQLLQSQINYVKSIKEVLDDSSKLLTGADANY